jgi:hypothetical protein
LLWRRHSEWLPTSTLSISRLPTLRDEAVIQVEGQVRPGPHSRRPECATLAITASADSTRVQGSDTHAIMAGGKCLGALSRSRGPYPARERSQSRRNRRGTSQSFLPRSCVSSRQELIDGPVKTGWRFWLHGRLRSLLLQVRESATRSGLAQESRAEF